MFGFALRLIVLETPTVRLRLVTKLVQKSIHVDMDALMPRKLPNNQLA